jgi:hypothetical protein
MRPGTRVRFWSPGYKNKPTVEPPLLLRIVASLCIISVVGVLIYGVSSTLDGVRSTSDGSFDAAYVAILHFVLPFCVFYTVSTNSWLSRPLIAMYAAILSGATILGKGFLGGLVFDTNTKILITAGIFVAIVAWLFGSKSMRLYYLLLADKRIPPQLEPYAIKLAQKQSRDSRAAAAIEWLVDHLETVVMLGFIVVVVIAWLSQSIY